jgi:hypothetical protein
VIFPFSHAKRALYSRTWTEQEEQKKNLLFVRVKLRGNQVAQIGDVWLESAAGTVVGKEGGMKRSRVSPEPNNSAPCRARFLRNKIFFFFFHLLLCCLLLTTFFFRLPKNFFFQHPAESGRGSRAELSLRSMCIYAEPFSGGNFCATHNSPHRF